jgi:fibronectin-binding autotransporter adhesin
MIKRFSIVLLAIALQNTVGLSSTFAQRTWTGGGTDSDWGTAGNWSTNTVPSGNVGPITFSGTTQPVTNNNVTGLTGNLLFTNTATGQNFTLNGNDITLNGNIVTTAAATGSTLTDTINLGLILNIANRNINAATGHNLIINGNISGPTFGITKTGAATLTLGGNNTFTGITAVNNGVLLLSSANAIAGGLGAAGGLSNINVNGGTLGLGNGDLTRVLGSSADQIRLSASTSGFAAYGANRVVNFGGNVTPTPIVWGVTDGFFSALPTAPVLVLSDATATGLLELRNPIDIGALPRTFNVPNGSSAIDARLSGVLSGTAGVVKAAGGTLELTGNNTFTGGFTIQQGTVQVSSIANVGEISNLGTGSVIGFGNANNTGTLLIQSSSDLTTNRQISLVNATATGTGGATINSASTGSVVFTNPVFNTPDLTATAARTLTIGGASTNLLNRIQGLIQDNNTVGGGVISLTKGDVGNWNLENVANTFSGQLAVNNGTLVVAKLANSLTASSIGTGSTNSVIRFGNNNTTGNLVYTGSGDSTDRQVTIGNGTGTGGGTITNNGTGALTFSNPAFNQVNASTGGSKTLTLGGSNTGDNTISGAIIDSGVGSAVALTKNGAGKWILGGANTYTGGTIINEGTLSITGTIASTSVNVALGASLITASPINATTGNTVVNGALSGTGQLSVGALATLSGTGSISKPTTIFGTLAAGNSPGVLSFGNGLTQEVGSSLSWELISNTDTGRGTNFDGVDVTGGNLAINGLTTTLVFNGIGSTVNFADPFWSSNRQWTVFANASGTTTGLANLGAITTTLDSVGNSIASFGSFGWTQSSQDLVLNYSVSAVPEPSSIALVIVGAGFWVMRRRRLKLSDASHEKT